jgi:tetratricopeptide (TPR) repeat protein
MLRHIQSIAFLILASSACAQAPQKTLNLILPEGTGAIKVSYGNDWHPSKLFLYDNGTRVVTQLSNEHPGLELSYTLFSGLRNATSENCREDVMGPLLKRFDSSITKKSIHSSDLTTSSGLHLATESYAIDTVPPDIADVAGVHIIQENLFGFYGNQQLCAEVHISQIGDKAADPTTLQQTLMSLSFILDYKPTVQDYGTLASVLYSVMHDYASAAAYYSRALAVSPAPENKDKLNFIRFLTDQTAMSYGISGDLKRSREVNLAAIAKDPDYPLYYYNLACADAESGDAAAARTHLQQAFDRSANTLPGECLPDPSKDDSILKLKKNRDFWAFVQSLPKS